MKWIRSLNCMDHINMDHVRCISISPTETDQWNVEVLAGPVWYLVGRHRMKGQAQAHAAEIVLSTMDEEAGECG